MYVGPYCHRRPSGIPAIKRNIATDSSRVNHVYWGEFGEMFILLYNFYTILKKGMIPFMGICNSKTSQNYNCKHPAQITWMKKEFYASHYKQWIICYKKISKLHGLINDRITDTR